MLIDKNLNTPLYIQLYENIRNLIEEDNFKEGEKLPSIRSLADKLDVNNITVVNAYKLLEQEGYVYSIKGSGTYVRKTGYNMDISYMEDGDIELMIGGVLPISKNSINFASVSPTPEIFPIEEFKQALIEVLNRDKGSAFVYPEINGYEPFRESITSFLHENYNMTVDKEQIQVISGGQQGIDIITKTLISQGDCIFVENPTYSGAIAAFQSRGAKIMGVPMLEDGLDLDTFYKYIKRYRPKFLYMMTNYQSPTTYSYSEEKKKKLIELSKKYNFYIIEDDFLTDLNYDNSKKTPLKSMDDLDQVIYIKSFSKIFMPGVRIGFMTVPQKLFKDIIRAKHTTDISSSGFLQRAFDLYLRKGYWKKHIETIKKVYTEKYNTMVEELDRLKKYDINFIKPNGGLSIWVKLPKEIDSIDLYNECVENNVALVPGKIFFIDDSIYSNYIRLSFGAVSNEEIVQGIKIVENYLRKKYNDDNNEYLPFV
ncbi:Transcriptional regulator, GntR family with aminotransferase domain [[Clostridium] ultunense Esp]|uniref:Transcriptional regulator, GntR family with aminotransferase domain n=1 Tax=[Clostridium] ultunense Esp TaxID=1288971 RepID=M1ZIJ5_9FIRM|nr:PLP-dependent aminotransferase family protein [Schnuerera ultunensis]CCQ98253.1 Transcriptional regulator, GntR family with aminotransferase domain [[Clostridium] ultunense Esp]SHD76002.1 Transcriptional regulator, GntR family with aminotransferase domain [[Clostridium] ultunense Esp]